MPTEREETANGAEVTAMRVSHSMTRAHPLVSMVAGHPLEGDDMMPCVPLALAWRLSDWIATRAGRMVTRRLDAVEIIARPVPDAAQR